VISAPISAMAILRERAGIGRLPLSLEATVVGGPQAMIRAGRACEPDVERSGGAGGGA
jgi:hypothetical protein